MDIDTLTLPFRFGFMQNAFLISMIVSVPTALLSCFLVVKGWALMGDAVSHAVLPGIVLAYILGIPLIIGAFAAGMTCAVATGYLASNSRVKLDTVMGVVFSGMFGLGIVMYVSIETNAHLDHILFGNMLGVETGELWTAAIISLVVGLMLTLKWRDWLLHSFDPAQAQASGLRVNWLHYGMLAALSLTIVATLSAVGLILAIGLLIAPGAIAFLLVRTFGRMLWVSVLVCMISMLLGSYLSFFLDSAPAPTIILILTVMFIIAFVRRQIITRRMSARRVQDTVA
ncbi:metal ABC transporter permease [Sulfitobacter geojensis]|uniref:Metal ABC transporter permease n=1 Tax=Sulfitobacter geojensis TaxID=1342299 RepID=A0AAE2W0E2_9RHOB|nr:metal ABC transporter permease [Sulfitobacter geojensis]MBM1689931.1 metal ABC transporter permease [Sulfitobacter geojensis]MBM1693997.1 metal ABC transporter permease [Sulfitobacter geojensis]MBM1706163.1 metal ABC transporter permease [Sulfitobacter geojensis]MBM1710221.1 metal ABC transporter permease [Sulfitobacter geojensis]MBM1714287.1 metal ABC transporter permease [Sulfitobacter geojensis]